MRLLQQRPPHMRYLQIIKEHVNIQRLIAEIYKYPYAIVREGTKRTHC